MASWLAWVTGALLGFAPIAAAPTSAGTPVLADVPSVPSQTNPKRIVRKKKLHAKPEDKTFISVIFYIDYARAHEALAEVEKIPNLLVDFICEETEPGNDAENSLWLTGFIAPPALSALRKDPPSWVQCIEPWDAPVQL